jgi:hypothetical protein
LKRCSHRYNRKSMITSTDKITVAAYFDIICSDPLDLSPLGFGTKKARMRAWMKIRQQDDELNPMHSNEVSEMAEEYKYLSEKYTKLRLCCIALGGEKETQNTDSVLEGYGIIGGDKKSKIARAVDQAKGTVRLLKDITKTFEERGKIKNTKADCMKQLMMIAKHFPVSLKSSLSEYRGAQRNYIELVEAMKKDGNTDN